MMIRPQSVAGRHGPLGCGCRLLWCFPLVLALALCDSASTMAAGEQPKPFTIEFLVVEMPELDFKQLVLAQSLPGVGAKVSVEHSETSANILNGKIGKIVARPRLTLTSGTTGRVRLGSDLPVRYLKQDNDGRFHVETLSVPAGYDIEASATREKGDLVVLSLKVNATFVKDRTPLEGAPEILAGPPLLSQRLMETDVVLKEGYLLGLGGLAEREEGTGQTDRTVCTAYFCRLVPAGEVAPTGSSSPPAKMTVLPSTITGTATPSAGFSFSPEVLERVMKSVVKVEARRSMTPGETQAGGWGYGGGASRSRPNVLVSTTITGFIIRADGYIVTASQLPSATSEAKVILFDGRILTGKVRGRDPETWSCVIKVDAADLPTARWTGGEPVRLGQPIFTFGHPFGMDNTLITGIVTTVDRRLAPGGAFESGRIEVEGGGSGGSAVPFLQTNTPIPPGCSGGPVCDSSGAVIGMNVASYVEGESSPSISFAVPATELRRAVNEIIEKGKVERAFLGVFVAGPASEADRERPGRGVTVTRVIPGGPADKAGLRAGDVIQKADGRDITPVVDLPQIIAAHKPGDVVRILLLRDGKEMQLDMEVGTRGTDVIGRQIKGLTPLHVAAFEGQAEDVKLLLAKGADVDAKDNEGRTPLHYAAGPWGHSSASVVKLLLDKGADISAKENKGRTPLHYAAAYCDVTLVKLLLDKGADINARTNAGQTPLHEAAFEGQAEAVKLLLAKGADVNAKDNGGETPFYLARLGQEDLQQPETRRKGKDEVAKLLLAKGADQSIDTVPCYRADQLLSAVGRGDVTAITDLLAKGADVNARNDNGVTPLHRAAGASRAELVKLLLAKGADVNAKDTWGCMPLHYTAIHGNTDVVKLLLDKGADVNVKSKDGITPLFYWVAFRGQAEVAKLLLARGANVNAKDSRNGRTPLHYVASNGQGDAAKLLLENGANVNAKDNDGLAPLHEASRMGRAGVVKLLLAKGANVNAKDNKGHTPLYWATHGRVLDKKLKKPRAEVAKLLRAKGGRE